MAIAGEQNQKEQEFQAVKELHQSYHALTQQIATVVVGMDQVIEEVMITMLCRGHGILEGVPGLAKTLLISRIGEMLGLTFRRIQFTPDLMPSDITGTDVLEEERSSGKRVFRFIKGPLFGNIVLADEINRTPPKTQSALLEAMQERQVTAGGETYPLPHPFFVLATQNPIEQEGTYPLPEAQLDRFMMKIQVGYPSESHELEIVKRVTVSEFQTCEQVLDAEKIERMQQIVRRVPVADHVYEFAVRLARATRPEDPRAPEFVGELISWGAGPRASIYLIMAAKARAILHGRFHATTDDVIAAALPVLRHRVVPTFNAEASGQSADDIIRRLIKSLAGGPPPVPQAARRRMG